MKGRDDNLGDPGVDGSIIQITWRSNNRIRRCGLYSCDRGMDLW